MLAERKLIGAASAAVAAFMHNPLNKTKSNQKPMPFLCVKIKSLLPVRTERALRCCFTTKQRMELLLPKTVADPKKLPQIVQKLNLSLSLSLFPFLPILAAALISFFPSDLFIESSAQINKVTDSIMQSRPAAASAFYVLLLSRQQQYWKTNAAGESFR